METVVTNSTRARQIIRVLVKHGFGHLLDRMRLDQVPGVGRLAVRLGGRGTAARSPFERARMAMEELGPTFVKLGQLVASRPDLVGPEAAAAFADLQDRVPPFPGEEALAVIDQVLPGVRQSLLADLSREPAAAASIAQVHFGTATDGTPVAVKVRRPGIGETVETDIGILFVLARLIERHVPEASAYQPVKVAREFARNIRREMDFTIEAASVQRFGENFAGDDRLVIPRVFWEATSPQVLTVERLTGGVPVDEPESIKAAGSEPVEIARTLVDAFLKQVLEDGFFHGDPHAGNLLVLPGGRIGVLDFGIMGQLDHATRLSLVGILGGLVDLDLEELVGEYLKLGILGDDVDTEALKVDLGDLLRPYHGLPLKRIPLGEFIFESVQITMRHHLKVPPDVVLLAKSWVTLEGILRRLDPDLDLVELAGPRVRRLLRERWAPGEIGHRLAKTAESYGDLLQAFPEQVRQILAKLVRGKLRIDFHHENLPGFTREMDRSANRLSFSMVISATIIASSLVILADRGYKVFGYPLLGVAGFFVAGILGLALAVAILRSGRL